MDDTWSPTRIGTPGDRYLHTAVWTGTEMIVWSGIQDGYAVSTGGRYNPSTDSWVATAMGAAVPEERYLHTAVWTGTEMIVWGGFKNGYPVGTGGRYNPSTDTWVATSVDEGAPTARSSHTALWTGTEMIVWGGYAGSRLNTGARYDPITDHWLATSTATEGRSSHTAVWTGTEMIVWGGNDGLTGARYNPATDSWTATSPATDRRSGHTAVWTGTEMIVWGGAGAYPTGELNTGGRYNPATNSWTATSTGTGTPSPRRAYTAVWTGTEMIVWGGETHDFHPLGSGGRYNPTEDRWVPTSTGSIPGERSHHTAIWTGEEMIVWGGVDAAYFPGNGGARYSPLTDSWVPTSNVPDGRRGHTAVWTGAEMIVWGGNDSRTPPNTDGRYDPSTDSWKGISTEPGAPATRTSPTAVWTGTEMIVWGGEGFNSTVFDTGGRYSPTTDTWVATSTGENVPSARSNHGAVWTGREMIVWGGLLGYGIANTGGRYDPASDSWRATSTGANVPSARYAPTAVWTGTEMIVWGGRNYSPGFVNTGGRYNPSADAWVATSTGENVPSARSYHTAVWTGTEMIVWGGFGSGYSFFDTGGRYNPSTDSWLATSRGGPDVPLARSNHTAVWSGMEMIVWGGSAGYPVGDLNTGGRYNPSTDSWMATSTGGDVPSARTSHTVVWTGTEMIVWGGYSYETFPNTGGRYCACPIPTTSHRDSDGDGYGDALLTIVSCDGSVPPGYVADGTDCDDSSPAIHPGAPETCNGTDDDCNGIVDDGGNALCDDGDPCTDDTCDLETGCVFMLVDVDADAICDLFDECPNSNLGLQVSIAGCDSGVSNTLFSTGCTLQDRINACGVGVQSHGQFVSCVSDLANDLRAQGILTGRQMGRIQRCAARSNPHPAPRVIRAV